MMDVRVLEVNVDDMYSGGVFELVKNVIINKHNNIKIDIGAIESFVNPENIKMLNDLGTDIHYIGYEGNKWKKQIICFFNVKKLLKEHPYDYIHIHSDVANKLLVSGIAAKCAGAKKIILHSHAAGVDGKHRVMKRVIHKLCRPFLKLIGTKYVACSYLAAEWMFPNIKKNEIININNGVDLEKFRFNWHTKEDERRKLGIKDELLLGHVGRFAYQKNHDYLIDIVKELKKQGIQAKLLLVGEGPDEQLVRDKVKQNGLEDIVIFYGTSNRVQDLFQAMDVFILPSHFEGLPIVGVEAQAAGLPVIFSDQITREAKLTNQVKYLPIDSEHVKEWVRVIQQMAQLDLKREDTYFDLKNKKFSIQDTVESFLKLYQGC